MRPETSQKPFWSLFTCDFLKKSYRALHKNKFSPKISTNKSWPQPLLFKNFNQIFKSFSSCSQKDLIKSNQERKQMNNFWQLQTNFQQNNHWTTTISSVFISNNSRNARPSFSHHTTTTTTHRYNLADTQAAVAMRYHRLPARAHPTDNATTLPTSTGCHGTTHKHYKYER